VSQELNFLKNSVVKKTKAHISNTWISSMRRILPPQKKPCQDIEKIEIPKEFLTLTYEKWFFTSVGEIRRLIVD